MKPITREIFLALNFPNEKDYTFSNRPSPYNISKNTGISPSQTYQAWNDLISKNIIQNLILIATDARRYFYILLDVDTQNLNLLESKLNQLYFVETYYYVHIYKYHINNRTFSAADAIIFEILSDSLRHAHDNIEIVKDVIKAYNSSIIDINNSEKQGQSAVKYDSIFNYILHCDIRNISIGSIAKALNISLRTVRRKIDFYLSHHLIEILPFISQSDIHCFNSAVLTLPKMLKGDNLKNKVMEIFNDYYLLYRETEYFINILFYYDSPGQLDGVIELLKDNFKNFFIFSRFIMGFNHSSLKFS